MNIFLSYIAVFVPLLALDFLWILVVAKKFYTEQMGFLFAKSFNLIPAAVFYPLYAVGVLMLAVLPAVTATSWVEALWRGALLGLVAYGTYDLTNQVTIAGWPTAMTLVDIAWGTFVTGLVSVIAYFIIAAFR